MSRPWSMRMTSSTICPSSASRWLDTSTVRPSSTNMRSRPRNQWTPRGRVRSQVRRESARADRRAARRRVPAVVACPSSTSRRDDAQRMQVHQLEYLVHAAVGDARRAGQYPQCVPPRSSRMEDVRIGERAHGPRRVGQRGVRLPSINAVPEVGRVRPTSIRKVVDLPAPLAPTKPVTVPGSRVKVTSSTAVTRRTAW